MPSFFSSLFGRKDPETGGTGAETHEGFTITPAPVRDGGAWRIAAVVEKDGRTHKLIRADTLTDRDEAARAAIAKARQAIDEQGDRIFGDG